MLSAEEDQQLHKVTATLAVTLRTTAVHLLSSVLMPLHRPNDFIEWRDQVPVIQLYHENLVRCLVRLVQWDRVKVSSAAGSSTSDCSGGTSRLPQPLHETDQSTNMLPSLSLRRAGGLAASSALSGGTRHDGGRTLLVQIVTELLGSLWPEGFSSNTPKEVLLLHEVTHSPHSPHCMT